MFKEKSKKIQLKTDKETKQIWTGFKENIAYYGDLSTNTWKLGPSFHRSRHTSWQFLNNYQNTMLKRKLTIILTKPDIKFSDSFSLNLPTKLKWWWRKVLLLTALSFPYHTLYNQFIIIFCKQKQQEQQSLIFLSLITLRQGWEFMT